VSFCAAPRLRDSRAPCPDRSSNRRFTMTRGFLIASSGLTVFAAGLLPAVASADHNDRRHHHHHHRGAHARLERFGSGNPAAPARDDAGTVVSFTGGTLTIKLRDGSSVTGKVTNATELKCEGTVAARLADHSRGDSGGPENDARDSGGNGGGNGDGERHGGSRPSGAMTEPGDGNGQDVNDNGHDVNDGNGQDVNDDNGQDVNDVGHVRDQGQGHACDPSSPAVGTVVREAELRVGHAGAAFSEVDLV
jgi:hypothetical protein